MCLQVLREFHAATGTFDFCLYVSFNVFSGNKTEKIMYDNMDTCNAFLLCASSDVFPLIELGGNQVTYKDFLVCVPSNVFSVHHTKRRPCSNLDTHICVNSPYDCTGAKHFGLDSSPKIANCPTIVLLFPFMFGSNMFTDVAVITISLRTMITLVLLQGLLSHVLSCQFYMHLSLHTCHT